MCIYKFIVKNKQGNLMRSVFYLSIFMLLTFYAAPAMAEDPKPLKMAPVIGEMPPVQMPNAEAMRAFVPPKTADLPEMPAAPPVMDEEALRRLYNPPPAIIANLLPEDKKKVMAFVKLVNEFGQEIRDKEKRFATNFDGKMQERMLERAFKQEGAFRRFRFVAPDNLPTAERLAPSNSPTINKFVSAFDGPRSADHLNRKQEHVVVNPANRKGRKNCMPHFMNEHTDREDFICFEHEPTDWVLSNYEERDWFYGSYPAHGSFLTRREMVDGEEAISDGEISRFLGRVNNEFYGRYGRIVERLVDRAGKGETSSSIFISGLRLDYNEYTLRAQLNKDGKWVLHPAMRQALADMQDYMEKAQRSWRSYEKALSEELPPLYVRSLARSVRYIQGAGQRQEPLYAELLALYKGTPFIQPAAEPLREAREKARAQYASFINRHAAPLREIQRLFDCAAGKGLPPPPVNNDLGWQIFHDPAFYLVEMAEDIKPSTRVPDVEWHEKGKTQDLAVAPPTSGLRHMPAGGGVTLEECGLVRDRGLEGAQVEIAEAEILKLSAYGAADEARP